MVPGTGNEGSQGRGTKWDSRLEALNDGTQMLGPKCLDVNMVTNVHVSTKSTVGTLEHSFKSVDEGR